jgi:hypothetical protein
VSEVGRAFVCHASEDAAAAQLIVASLEAAGVPCWVAPRDIAPGSNYAAAILDALDEASLLVLAFSKATNSSPHVQRELERATDRSLPILPVDLDGGAPSRTLRYFIGTAQWLEAAGRPAAAWTATLADAAAGLLASGSASAAPAPGHDSWAPAPAVAAAAPADGSAGAVDDRGAPRRRWTTVLAGAAIAVVVGAGVLALARHGPGSDGPSSSGERTTTTADDDTGRPFSSGTVLTASDVRVSGTASGTLLDAEGARQRWRGSTLALGRAGTATWTPGPEEDDGLDPVDVTYEVIGTTLTFEGRTRRTSDEATTTIAFEGVVNGDGSARVDERVTATPVETGGTSTGRTSEESYRVWMRFA